MLTEQPNGVTARNLHRQAHLPNADAAKKILDGLVSDGIVERIEQPTRGRPTQVYKLKSRVPGT